MPSVSFDLSLALSCCIHIRLQLSTHPVITIRPSPPCSHISSYRHCDTAAMSFDTLYICPRPTVFYEPRVARSATVRMSSDQCTGISEHSPSSRLTAVPVDVDDKDPVAKLLKRRRSQEYPPSYCPEENVAEVLKLKQRLRAWRALQAAAASGMPSSGEPPELVTSSPSTSCFSSPTSSPPTTPRMLPDDLPFPSQQDCGGDSVQEAGPSRSLWLGRSMMRAAGPAPPNPARVTDHQGASGKKHRPPRSRSSVIHRSLSRHSSQGSVSSTSSSASATTSTVAIMELMRRLAPLPRFNPYRRVRAQSMTAVIDDAGRELGDTLCGLLPRRRCKSEPSPHSIRSYRIGV
ncbi:hypothetical protein OH77DRAFT_429537 [Trametes cingulata]|nr:hypothetical protein OH77DRAFT_429537 [Trametes cingulata]